MTKQTLINHRLDYNGNPFPADSFKKHKIKTNPNMCTLMYFKIQSDQPRVTRNALKSHIFDLFTKSSSGHK